MDRCLGCGLPRQADLLRAGAQSALAEVALRGESGCRRAAGHRAGRQNSRTGGPVLMTRAVAAASALGRLYEQAEVVVIGLPSRMG
ncbi:hypothetical protein GCM10010232_27590 [Streptomyces amakusaensis]